MVSRVPDTDLPPSCPGELRRFGIRTVIKGQSLAVLLLTAGILFGVQPGCFAGDILRGGATAASGRKAADARANAGAAAAELAKVKAADRLARTTQAVNAMRQMQSSARALSGSSVPDGLVAGGLKVLTGPNAKWTGANAPVQTGKIVSIKQTQQQALLNWETFNVGRNTVVNFDQKAGGSDSGKWIAFNKIFDPTGQPSKILGSIKADGQVYLINQNGIVFGAGSQVNARTFVASSLPINDNLVASGLLNNRDAQFLFSALPVPGGSDGTPAFLPVVSGPIGAVVVQRGASLQSQAQSGGNGGRIMLVAPRVRNDGIISTPFGQTILAAGLQVGIQSHAGSDPSLRGLDVWVGAVGSTEGSATNNGLIEAQTGSILMTGRSVMQNGILESSTSVNLNGRIDLNASYGAVGNPNFDNPGLTGSGGPSFLYQQSGLVTFAPGSVTRILPDVAGGAKIPGLKLSQSSQLHVTGLVVRLASGSMIQLPGGEVDIRAGTWPFVDGDGDGTALDSAGNPQAGLAAFFSGANQRFLMSKGQIYMDSGAMIDVAGATDVFVPIANSILSVQLRGSELADSPLQRDQAIRGQSLTIDIRRSGTYQGRFWMGTPLGDATGLAGLVERDVLQLLARGGSVTFAAGGSIVTQKGSLIDASGGFYRNEGGYVDTTRVLRGSTILDISNATPDVTYNGVFSGTSTTGSSKWNVSKTFLQALAPTGRYYQKEYIEGASAGAISLSAPAMVVAGELVAASVTGPRQLNSPAKSGSLTLSFQNEKMLTVNANDIRFLTVSPTPPLIEFSGASSGGSVPAFSLIAGEAPALSAAASGKFLIPDDLFDKEKGGFGHLTIQNIEGDVQIGGNGPFHMQPGGSLTVVASNISVTDSILIPGGSIAFTAYNFSPFLTEELKATGVFQNSPSPLPREGKGAISIGTGVRIDVSGMLVDERPGSDVAFAERRVIQGGSIALEGYSIDLAKGSFLDASGGALAKFNGKYQFGDGGSISILSGKDPALSTITGGTLVLEGGFRAYSGAVGGALTIQANMIQLGGSTDPGVLTLQPEFFQQGGFTNYSLIGIGKSDPATGGYLPAIRVVSGTSIEPVALSYTVAPFSVGSDAFQLVPSLKPVGLRSPASIRLAALGADDAFTENTLEIRGDILIEEGAGISTDPGGKILIGTNSALDKVQADSVTVLGLLSAPGGLIAIYARDSFRLPKLLEEAATSALPTVHIGSTARISTAGVFIPTPDAYGRVRGNVYDGGTISIAGNVVAEAGAVLDVSGTYAFLDLDPAWLIPSDQYQIGKNTGVNVTPLGQQGINTRVDSNGGLIEFKGGQMLLSDATLLGRAGGPTAVGGTLSVSSGRFYSFNQTRTSADINLIVSQNGNVIPAGADVRIGVPVSNGAGGTISGIGYFSVDRFSQGGFDSLDLGFSFNESASPIAFGGNVQFEGNVSIAARGSLRVAGGGILQTNGNVQLSAPYIAIGQEFRPPLNPGDVFLPFQKYEAGQADPTYNAIPTFGLGSLSVNASLIDVGTLVLKNTGKASLTAAGGDIRGSGTLAIAGDLTLTAGQIYPLTLSTFNIFAYDHAGGTGSVTIVGSGVRPLPYSAGGSLNIYATNIIQGGTLRAPFGSISIGWDGTDLDPSDADLDSPSNPATGLGLAVPIAQNVSFQNRSVTSVSAVDPLTNKGILVPFGLSPDGLSWIDPRGVNVTVSGIPEKSIHVAGKNITTDGGSMIDIRGGGDLIAYRWISGVSGTRDLLGEASEDWSAGDAYAAGDLVRYQGQTWSARAAIDPADFDSSPTPGAGLYWSSVPDSFAVIPDYALGYAPFGRFNTGSHAADLGGDPGYLGRGLKVGDAVYLDGGSGLAAGRYTLLPRRYAILPGAFLVTPQNATSQTGIHFADGSVFVSGVRGNVFSQPASRTNYRSSFEVLSPAVLAQRVAYEILSANSFMGEAARRLDLPEIQRLPDDGGYLGFQSISGMSLMGDVLAQAANSGRGAQADISSAASLVITGPGSSTPAPGSIKLDAQRLSSWGIGSLLIGGIRRTSAEGVEIRVNTGSVTLDNPGGTFSGPEILLVANNNLTLSSDSGIASSGAGSGNPAPYHISGDGLLLSVSGDAGDRFTRGSTTTSTLPLMTIGAGARIAGKRVVVDSTGRTNLSPFAILDAQNLDLGSGQISIVLNPGAGALLGSTVSPHLVLSGDLLTYVQSVSELTLRSYRTLDFYGAGTLAMSPGAALKIFSAGIRGYGQGGGNVVIQSSDLVIGNPSNVAVSADPVAAPSGTFKIDSAGTIQLTDNSFRVAGFANTILNAGSGLFLSSTGTFSSAGNLNISTPLISGATGATYSVTAAGDVQLLNPGGISTLTPGIGSTLNITGAAIEADTSITLPSGRLVLRAKTGNLIVGGSLNVDGTSRDFYDAKRFADAGEILLTADAGNVELQAGSTVSVAADPLGGNAGYLTASAAQGSFIDDGLLRGAAVAGYRQGSFTMDAASLLSFADLSSRLETGGFLEERNFRLRTGSVAVTGTSTARLFSLSTDQGGIQVSGEINASGKTGGKILLSARDSVTLLSGSKLTVAAQGYDSAGKGGEIRLEAGAERNGIVNTTARVDLQSGSTVDLSVAESDQFLAGDFSTVGSAAFYGLFSGKLSLRAPRVGNTFGVESLAGSILGASSIVVEGYQLYDRTGMGTLDQSLRNTMNADASAFITAAEAAGERGRLLAANPAAAALDATLVLAPGVEIINRAGDLSLGSPGALSTSDWDLSSFRYGSRGAAGILTLRASGDLVFNNTLSDGFNPVAASSANGHSSMWMATLMTINAQLPANAQSWSYRLSAGSDLSAADYRSVLPQDALASGKGSLLVGEYYSAIPNSTSSGPNAGVGSDGLTASSIRISTSPLIDAGTRYEVVRTGTGDIGVYAGRDVKLRNQFATIYTAGVALPTPTKVYKAGDFILPVMPASGASHPGQGGDLGAVQQTYQAQWTLAGGELTLIAGNNIGRYTKYNGDEIADTSRQMPSNWLYRRGYVDPATGLFGRLNFTSGLASVNDLSASTAWWIDYSNFFQGFGTLGGGNLLMKAGNDVINADAVTPTNARMPGRDPVTGMNLAPDDALLLEHGGGDLTVIAGRDISGGFYYVERGKGTLTAGREVTTNSARSPSYGILHETKLPTSANDIIQSRTPEIYDPSTWLPTTLFLGKGGFDVTARGDVLIGPTVNAFLMPAGLTNKFWYKSYFPTYAPSSFVNVTSLGGDVTHRLSTTMPLESGSKSILVAWMEKQNLFLSAASDNRSSHYQPWIRLAETDVSSFSKATSIAAPTLRSTAMGGDINIVGEMNLFPSPSGTLELLASGGIIGLQSSGRTQLSGLGTVTAWSSATVNLSDASPDLVAGVSNPFGYFSIAKTVAALRSTQSGFLSSVDSLFSESGSYSGQNATVDRKRARHAPGILHANDSEPVMVYAGMGDISGLTLFSPKASRIVAGRDISDVSLYLQNSTPEQITLVSAGRDIIPSNANSGLRAIASNTALGNVVTDVLRATASGRSSNILAGDIQINGSGVLEVFAGRNLDLGVGENFSDGTGTGITSIGNARNPFLSFEGARIVAMAGVGGLTGGPALGLISSSLGIESLLANLPGNTPSGTSGHTPEHEALAALDSFFEVLKQTGRDYPVTGSYASGFAAVASLFGSTSGQGEIFTRSRDIRTANGGAITLAAPGGGITMASDIFGNPLTPPGIVTEYGGEVAIYTKGSVDIGRARIFTLRGGDMTIWSSDGDIAAGTSPKTVVTAPPTRVLIDSTSADVVTDLGGLATGGGIGVLASVEDVEPGNVYLLAPNGTVDAGDAGIQSTGNLTIAAVAVVNADNISAGGTSAGVPSTPTVAAPNIGGLTSGSSASSAANSAASQVAGQARQDASSTDESPSLFSVEVLGYGGSDEEEEERESSGSEG